MEIYLPLTCSFISVQVHSETMKKQLRFITVELGGERYIQILHRQVES